MISSVKSMVSNNIRNLGSTILNSEGVFYRRLFFACRLLLFTLLPLSSAFSVELGCRASEINEWSKISYVYDGDTVKLHDGRVVRLIGIDAPERAKHSQVAEPFSRQATTRLRALFTKNNNIALQYETERFDKYGRTLAHLYLPDGRNVEEQLLRAGLATTLVFPPNVDKIECLMNAENRARNLQKGIWSLKENQLKYVGNLKRDTVGFTRLYGQIVQITCFKSGALLSMDGPLQLYISKAHMKYFNQGLLHAFVGSKVEVQGQVYRYNKQLQIRITHPLIIKRM